MAGAPGAQLRTWYADLVEFGVACLHPRAHCSPLFCLWHDQRDLCSRGYIVFTSGGYSFRLLLCHQGTHDVYFWTRCVLSGLRFEAGWMQSCSCVLLAILCAHPLLERTVDPLFMKSAAMHDTLDIDRTTVNSVLPASFGELVSARPQAPV